MGRDVSAGQSASYAGGPEIPTKSNADKPQKPMAWEDPDRESCGFGCLYQRADEVLGLQAKYLIQKMDMLEAADRQGLTEERDRALSTFCAATHTQSDTDKCYALYKKTQKFALRKIQAAITQNYDSASRISNVKESGTFIKPVVRDMNPSVAKKSPQTPHIITYEDLEKKFPTMDRLEVLGSRDFERWSEGLPFRPSEDDFVKFSEAPVDPRNPAAGTMLVVARDESGRPVIDRDAFVAASEKYRKTMEKEAKYFAQSKAPPENRTQARNPQLAPQRGLSESEAQLNRQAFVSASEVRIESSIPANGKFQIQSTNSLNFGTSSQAKGKNSDSKAPDPNVSPVTDEDLQKKGVSYLYYSPADIGKVLDDRDGTAPRTPAQAR